MTNTVHEFSHGGVCIFCGYEKPYRTQPQNGHSTPSSKAEELLLAAYYRGKDGKGYSDKEYNLALDKFEQNLLKALEEV